LAIYKYFVDFCIHIYVNTWEHFICSDL